MPSAAPPGSLRVAFLTVGDTARRTGGYLYNARLCAGLREWGHAVDEVSLCGAAPDEQRAAPGFDPAPYDLLVVDALARIAVAPHLERWRASTPVVTLVHELASVAGGAGEARREASSEVSYEVTCEAPLLRAERLVAVSAHGRQVLLERGAEPGRVSVVPPGFDRVELVDPAPSAAPAGGRQVLCVAQWIPRKSLHTLVAAWRVMLDRPHSGTRPELTLVGETEADPEYAERVRAAIGDEPSIRVAGVVPDRELAALYAGADLFALPSRYEGYGMVYAEALARGVPVVACEVGPVPEVVGGGGLLVPPDDPAALAHALERVLYDSRFRDELSRRALRRAGELPRWAAAVEAFERVIHEVREAGV